MLINCVVGFLKTNVMEPCEKCEKLIQKSNMGRHIKHHCPGKLTSSKRPLSRTSSVDTQESSTSAHSEVLVSVTDYTYSPKQMSALLSLVILEAVPALLDQHENYNREALAGYIGKFYAEISEQLRELIVVAATAKARQAALMHSVWEKNLYFPDEPKKFAAGAVSSLSFWALALSPVHRSGNVYKSKEEQIANNSVSMAQSVSQAPNIGGDPSTSITLDKDAPATVGVNSENPVVISDQGMVPVVNGVSSKEPTENSMGAGEPITTVLDSETGSYFIYSEIN